MDEADIDISEDVQTPEPESAPKDAAPAAKPFWFVPIVGLFFLLLALFLVLSNSRSSRLDQESGPSEALLSYQALTNEVHTGLRLARLEDFLAQYSDSPYAIEVRARRNALKRHEEKAWAKLTNAFYDAEADEESKGLAIKSYTDNWTPLLRPKQLKTLSQILPDDKVPNFKPGEKKSRFASGGNDQFLEGGPIVRRPVKPPQTAMRNMEPERIGPSRVIAPRIRGKARKPSYPSKAKRRRVEADVILALDIDDRGRVRQTRVISVRANRYAEDFAKAAIRAARRTRFYPKTVGGRAVATSGHVQKYAFRNNR